jgi:hypothetical protein
MYLSSIHYHQNADYLYSDTLSPFTKKYKMMTIKNEETEQKLFSITNLGPVFGEEGVGATNKDRMRPGPGGRSSDT